MPFENNRGKKFRPRVLPSVRYLRSVVGAGVRTSLLLQHPDLELDEAVGVEAVVLPDTAVATFVAADVQLVAGTGRPDLGVAHRALLEDVNQAPGRQTDRQTGRDAARPAAQPANGLTCGARSRVGSPGASRRTDRPCWFC